MRSASLIHTATIQVRKKKQKLYFDNGSVAFTVGDTMDGETSKATGDIESVTLETGSWASGTAAGYVILTNVSGTFQDNEVLGDEHSGAALANGTNADYENTYGESEYTWGTSQDGVTCRFYYQSATGGLKVHSAGEVQEAPLAVMLPGTVTINDTDYRITTTQKGFTGAYAISRVLARVGRFGIDHYEIVLQEVTA